MKHCSIFVTLLLSLFAFTGVQAQDNYDESLMGEKVYLETANWGQGTPFNNLCPEFGTTRAVTGCGPTAFAILCHYYKWPTNGTGSVTHNNETLDLSTHNYDYDKMLYDYNGTYSEEQATAVATLMRDLGYAAKVEYSASSTGFSENITALKSYFSYTNSIFNPTGVGMNALYRSDAGDESFKEQIKECLDKGYPVLFSSLSYNPEKDTNNGRHIFILDGYTENDYFHFNFGWGGSGNGWYTLDYVRTDEQSDYSQEQRAYLYVIPNKAQYPVTATADPVNAGTVTVNGTVGTANCFEGSQATLEAVDNSGYRFTEWTKDGVTVSTSKIYKVTVGTSNNDYVAHFVEYDGPVYGEFTISVATVTSGLDSTDRVNECSTDILRLASTDGKINCSGNNIQLYYGTSSTYTITTIDENCKIASYTIKCKQVSSYGILLNGESVTTSFAEYKFNADNTNTTSFTVSGSSGRFLTIESIVVELAPGEGGGETPTTYTVNVSANPAEGGYVSIGDGASTQTTVNAGEQIRITAMPNINYNFNGWYFNSQLISESTSVNVTPNASGTYEARFTPATPTTYTVSVNAENGTVEGAGQYTAGSNVTLIATANTGYHFVDWSDGSTTNPYTFTVNSNVTLTANFAADVVEPEPETPQSGYYYMINRDTGRYEYLYNNALYSPNTNRWTLQSNDYVRTNNGIWYITFNGDNTLGIKNGDGNPIVAGNGTNSFTTLNIGQTFEENNNTYYYFTQALNCSKDLRVVQGGELHITTWADNPEAIDNHWRFEAVDMAGKSVYDVQIDDALGANVYVTYTNGTTTEYAYDGGFFIAETINASNLAVVSNNDAIVRVDGNTITVKAAYTVTYMVDDEEYATETYEFGATVTPDVAAPTKEGYTFNGWENLPATMPANNVVVTGTFTVNTYTLTYMVDGEEHSTAEVAYGTAIEALEAPTKEGHTFNGWENLPATMPANDVVVTGTFTVNTYTLTYMVDGEEYATEIYEFGATVTPAVAAPTKEGHTFNGWENLPATMPAGNVEVNAIFEVNTPGGPTMCTVTVNCEYTTVQGAGEYEEGSEVTLTATPFDNYLFDGWYNSNDERVSTETTYVITVEGDVTYTAKSVASSTYYQIDVVVNGTLTNLEDVKAIIVDLNSDNITSKNVISGSSVTLRATQDYNSNGYLFDGWYVGDERLSTAVEYTFTANSDATIEARFSKGCVVNAVSNNKSYGYPTMVTYADGTPVVGAATDCRAVVREGEKVMFTLFVSYGFKVVNWTDEGSNTVSMEKHLVDENYNTYGYVVEVTGDNTYTVNLAPATYNLSVSVAKENTGSATATFEENTGTSVTVGHNEPATITAEPANGYEFSYWTLNGVEVAGAGAEYNVPAIENVEDMVDVEYVAHFVEAGHYNVPGYYRIAYKVPVANAASMAATRAAGEVEYSITPANGTPGPDSGNVSSWSYTKDGYPAGLTLTANVQEGIDIGDKYIDLKSGGYPVGGGGQVYEVTYTLSVKSGYEIAGYKIECGRNGYKLKKVGDANWTLVDLGDEFVVTDLSSRETAFVLAETSGRSATMYVNSFIVYIKEAGGETPEIETVNYYVQSVDGMTLSKENTTATSIFYYDGHSILSYSKGFYLNESGTACGMLSAGNRGEDVHVLDNGNDTYVIKTDNSFLCVTEEMVGTGTQYKLTTSENAGEFVLEPVETLPVTIKSAGYATFFAPMAVELPNGLEAYYLDAEGLGEGYASMTKIEGEGTSPAVIPANTGVILTGEGGEMATAGNYNLTVTTTNNEIESLLYGTVATEYVLGKDGNGNRAYYLAKPEDYGIGFYVASCKFNEAGNNVGAENGTYFLNNAHKAYLPMESVISELQGSYGFRFLFGTTGIDGVNAEDGNVGIYDLQGRKLEGIPGAGIYIVNGVKKFVK